ncbi:DUF7008 domain-containing protein [Streptomyces viridosporus]|uniref:DUF7008 domain-containing protein n=1 Tax=Streptomyces viridosporus TaxID=67581 RepID=UPI003F4D5FF3
MQAVARLYATDHLGKRDASLATVLAAVIEAEHVPYLAALRHKNSWLRKRPQWEQVWEQQCRLLKHSYWSRTAASPTCPRSGSSPAPTPDRGRISALAPFRSPLGTSSPCHPCSHGRTGRYQPHRNHHELRRTREHPSHSRFAEPRRDQPPPTGTPPQRHGRGSGDGPGVAVEAGSGPARGARGTRVREEPTRLTGHGHGHGHSNDRGNSNLPPLRHHLTRPGNRTP